MIRDYSALTSIGATICHRATSAPGQRVVLLVEAEGGHREFMNLIKSDVRYQKDRSFIFTTTIIAGDELQKLFPGD